jgi:hypothetical protein
VARPAFSQTDILEPNEDDYNQIENNNEAED